MLPALRTFNNFTHSGGWRRGVLFILFAVTTPIGHAVAVAAVSTNLFLWLFDREHRQRERTRETLSQARPREPRYTKSPPRPRPPREPFLDRDAYEAKIRDAMGNRPTWDFEGTAVEEPLPQLAVG